MGLRTAIRTLTILPVPEGERQDFGKAVLYFPLVGLLLGTILWGTGNLLILLTPKISKEIISILIVCLSFILTGGLHLDGLGDFMDSLGGKTRERRLEIMKDKHLGAFGVVGIVLDLNLKYTSLKGLIESPWFSTILIPMILSRAATVLLCSWLPYARQEGTGRPFVEGSKKGKALLIAGIAFMTPLGWNLAFFWISLASVVATIGLGHYFRSKYGGITGDLLGASSEAIELLGLTLLNMAI